MKYDSNEMKFLPTRVVEIYKVIIRLKPVKMAKKELQVIENLVMQGPPVLN